MVLMLRESEYVLAAQALGADPGRIITRHLIPNTLGILIIQVSFAIPGYIFAEAFLSFIGLGIQAPGTSWGALISYGQTTFEFYPHQLLFPAGALFLTVLAFNLFGDGLRDALDPRLRQ
jgi:oligopeptide transport system permease protein